MSRLVHPVARIRRVAFVVVVASASSTAPHAQSRDETQPPPILKSAGGFSARPLGKLPTIDGREWIAAEVDPTVSPGRVPLRTRAFALALTDCGDHGGDFVRCQVLFRRQGAAPVRIDAGYTGWVVVTPDSRYIITEPLSALDVREWKHYALFEALQIPNYTRIEAISRDGTRLLISRRDCAMDCNDRRVDYYELTFPR